MLFWRRPNTHSLGCYIKLGAHVSQTLNGLESNATSSDIGQMLSCENQIPGAGHVLGSRLASEILSPVSFLNVAQTEQRPSFAEWRLNDEYESWITSKTWNPNAKNPSENNNQSSTIRLLRPAHKSDRNNTLPLIWDQVRNYNKVLSVSSYCPYCLQVTVHWFLEAQISLLMYGWR